MLLRIELGDHKLDILTYVFGKVSFKCIGDKACGNKDPDAVKDHGKTAVHSLVDLTGQHFLAVECFLDLLIVLLGKDVPVAQHDQTLAVVDLSDLCFELVTDFYDGGEIQGRICGIIRSVNNTIRLVANVEQNALRLHIDDFACNYLSCTYCFERLIEHIFKTHL